MEAVFLKVLNMGIAAGWLILAVVLLRFLLRKAPKRLVCLLWAAVAVRLACPVTLQSVLSLIPSAETVSPDMLYAQRPAIQSGIAAVNRAVNPVLAASLSPEPAASANPLQILTAAACLVWLLGLAGMLVYTAVSYLRLHRQLAASVCIGGRVWLCDNIPTPFILGVARPRICLPSGMGEAEREPVVAHETAHLRRLDHIWKPLGFLLLAVYWFHPLCWLAYALFCRDLELACDESVVRTLDKRGVLAYSEALLACSAPHGRVGACPLAFGEVGVKARIKAALNYKKPAFWLAAAAVAACAAVAVCFLTDPAGKKSAAAQTAALEAGDVYVSSECLYMNPLSSFYAADGDSGSRYLIGADSFTVSDRATGAQQVVSPVTWRWQDFPWTGAEWDALFDTSVGSLADPSQRDAALQYQPLGDSSFLLRTNGQLWLAATYRRSDGTQSLWSIYSLVPESEAPVRAASAAASQSAAGSAAASDTQAEVSAVTSQSAAGSAAQTDAASDAQAAAPDYTIPAELIVDATPGIASERPAFDAQSRVTQDELVSLHGYALGMTLAETQKIWPIPQGMLDYGIRMTPERGNTDLVVYVGNMDYVFRPYGDTLPGDYDNYTLDEIYYGETSFCTAKEALPVLRDIRLGTAIGDALKSLPGNHVPQQWATDQLYGELRRPNSADLAYLTELGWYTITIYTDSAWLDLTFGYSGKLWIATAYARHNDDPLADLKD